MTDAPPAAVMVALLALSAAASPARATDLDALFAEAWAASPVVLRARADVEAAEASVAGASVVLPNPEIEAATTSDFAFARQGEIDFDVGVVQELAWPGARFATLDAGQSALAAAKARLAVARLDVAADVEAAVGALVAARASADAREEQLRVARALAESARRRLEAGAIGALDASLTLADAASAEAAALKAKALIADAEAGLCRALARSECALPALDWPALHPIDPKLAGGPVDERLDVRAARRDKAAADQRLQAAQLAWLPTARVGVGYAFERSVLDAPFLPQDVVDPDHLLSASLSITLPVWDWRRQDVLEATAERSRAEAAEREAVVGATSAVTAALRAYDAATAAAERLRTVQDTVMRSLDDVTRAYEGGALSIEDAMIARDRLLKSRLDFIEAERDRVASHAALLRALSRPLWKGIEENDVSEERK